MLFIFLLRQKQERRHWGRLRSRFLCTKYGICWRYLFNWNYQQQKAVMNKNYRASSCIEVSAILKLGKHETYEKCNICNWIEIDIVITSYVNILSGNDRFNFEQSLKRAFLETWCHIIGKNMLCFRKVVNQTKSSILETTCGHGSSKLNVCFLIEVKLNKLIVDSLVHVPSNEK